MLLHEIKELQFGEIIGYVEAPSEKCLKKHTYIATNNGNQFVYKHDPIKYILSQQMYKIKDVSGLFNYLYNSSCISGTLQNGLGVGLDETFDFFMHYNDLSNKDFLGKKVLDGNGHTIDIIPALPVPKPGNYSIFNTSKKLIITDTTFRATHPGDNNVVLSIIDTTGTHLELSGCNFNNINFNQNINVTNPNNTTVITNTVFNEVRPKDHYSGGAINTLGKLSINDSSFINNSTSGAGGAINMTHGLGNKISINNSSFINNTSGKDGGAIIALGANISLNGSCNFIGNTANGVNGGGALYAEGGGIILDGSFSFVNNRAKLGGALYAEGGDIILDGSLSFVNNSARRGGALYTENSGISLLTGPYEFRGNHATGVTDTGGKGGAIYSNNEITILTKTGTSTFTNNHADAEGPDLAPEGGALYANTGPIRLDGSFSFVNNSALVCGGALYTENSSISLLTGPYEFRDNHAGQGSHIWAQTDICYNGLVKTQVTFTDPICTGGGTFVNMKQQRPKCLPT
jgi:predicted outer membrane repeat protein